MRRVRWLVAVVVVALAATTSVAMAQGQDELEAVKDRLSEIQDEIEEAEAQAAVAKRELSAADQRLAEVEQIVNDLARRLAQQEERVDRERQRLEELEAEAAAVQAAFDERAVELFKSNFGSDLDAVLSAGDIQEAIDRQTMIQHLNESDRATIEQVRASQAAVETQQQILQAEVDRLAQVKAEQEEVLAQVREIRQSKALAAANARAEVVELANEEEDLEDEQAEIERLIKERAAPPPSIGPAPSSTSSGGYGWPNCGRVTSEYGYRWGRQHKGIDIDDNLTRAIVASRDGTVIFAGWSGGYGQMTLIDHHNGVVTAYAHQSSIRVSQGQPVSRGQYIGDIGSTGNSTGPHLHFEVRVNGAAQNPRGYLPSSC